MAYIWEKEIPRYRMNTAVLIWQSQKDLNHRRAVLRPFLLVENSIDMPNLSVKQNINIRSKWILLLC